MNRRAFLKAIGSAALLPMLPRRLFADSGPAVSGFRRRRPSDASWPSQADWKRLSDAVGGNLIPVESPISVLSTDPNGAAAKALAANLKNPYFIGEQPGLTQSSGWLDAWASKPSIYAVAVRNANDIAAPSTSLATTTYASWSRAEVIAIRVLPMRPIRFSSGRAT